MNFLQLSQRAATECGVASKSAIAAVLPSTSTLNGSLSRVVSWVADAWTELQEAHDDWEWMRSSVLLGNGVTFQTVNGQTSYQLGTGAGSVGVAPDAFGKWDCDTFRCQTTAIGFQDEIPLDEIGFDRWRNSYMMGAMRSVRTRPIAVAVGPDQSLNLGPPPTAAYTVTADYFTAPQVLAADADVPQGLPTRFHMLIVYRAMRKYAGYESAPEVYQRAVLEDGTMYRNLCTARAPRMSFGGPLA